MNKQITVEGKPELIKYKACGGCGNDDPQKVCIGCRHPFEPIPVKIVDVAHKKLIDFLIGLQVSEPEEFRNFIKQVEERFDITQRMTGTPKGATQLIERLIRWERGVQFNSLEKTLDNEFNVTEL